MRGWDGGGGGGNGGAEMFFWGVASVVSSRVYFLGPSRLQ